MSEKLKISYEDLNNPLVDAAIERAKKEESLRTGSGTASDELARTSLIYKNWFNLMLAGLFGAFLAWALIEPHVNDNDYGSTESYLLLLLLTVGAFVGLMIGSMEGILARNFSRALKAGLVGLAVGFGGGIVACICIGIVYTLLRGIGAGLIGYEAASDPVHHFSGFLLHVIIRSILWAILGMTVGLGPGIGLKSKKLVFNGFIGGMIGGAIGGMLFDPINYFVSGGTFDNGVAISRAIGFCVLGASTGLMIGMVETLSKEAWLIMTVGFLKGKQFIIYKNPTVIGSSPKCEIYLFKDPDIEPTHARINKLRDGYEIEEINQSRTGTWINGTKVKRQRLNNGDQVQIGKTVFTFSEKEKK